VPNDVVRQAFPGRIIENFVYHGAGLPTPTSECESASGAFSAKHCDPAPQWDTELIVA
jgi:hypothetical protein